ncbi:hypothetical protein IU448_15265 [Nocardia flavorosea]|uniref:hypothetical protein n=1 Tax=Nocardia flavorosea TaxID=53429 RepID=UPI0018945D11|nr:hypothetical protein [Nocardia flavorosea]MBF6350366.1 hypothetical protein [Nocardia flavorosea]
MTTVAEYLAFVAIRGINEGIGQSGIVQSFNATPVDGSLELPVGAPGAAGSAGPDAAPFRWEGDISDPGALSALAADLGPVHAGKAWRVESTNTLMYWNGTSFDSFPDAFGAAGPTGDVNTLSIGTVTTGAAGSDLVATVTGTPPSQTLDLIVPRGIEGAQGPIGGPGPIRGASDYVESAEPVDGAVPMWDSVAEKWGPVPDPGWRGPWSISEQTAWDGGAGFAASATNISTSPNTVAVVNVPAQDVDWRPMVFGGVQTRGNGGSPATKIDLEVLIGSAAGQIVALGTGTVAQVWWYNQIGPEYQALVTPDLSTGVISAGAPASIYLVLRRTQGSGTYSYSRTYAHAAVWAVPVTGAP